MNKNLIIALIFLQFVTAAQQINNEIPPPAAFVEQVEKLPLTEAKDTLASKTVLALHKESFTVYAYKLSRRYIKPINGAAESTKKINKLIAIRNTVDYQKLNLIYSLRNSAINLCRTDFSFTDTNPIQNKIAYSWGAKDYAVKQKPPGSGDFCKEWIHGLDCSGYIYQVLKANNITLPQNQCNADTERKPEFLRKYLQSFFGTKSFDVIDKGALNIREIESGDIIYFKNISGKVFHIGILFVNNEGKVILYQSLGQPNRHPESNVICEINRDSKHGPISTVISDDFLKKLNKNYGCVRVIGESL